LKTKDNKEFFFPAKTQRHDFLFIKSAFEVFNMFNSPLPIAIGSSENPFPAFSAGKD
jgi:hypothetical protein